MKKYLFLFFITTSLQASGQDVYEPVEEPVYGTFKAEDNEQARDIHRMYTLKPAVDIPIIATGTLWSAYAFTKIYSKDKIPDEKVAGLRTEDINAFDRWAAGNSSPSMDANSNYLFYGSIPLPGLLFIDKDIRKDAWPVTALYWESFAITGMLYTGSAYFIDRYRPETYDTRQPVAHRTSGNNKNAFLAGHVAVVANATFFMAKIYSDYHPHSNWKWAFWGGATLATGTMIYMRHAAGKHFPTDLIAGTALGTLSGILVPHFHKTRHPAERKWSLGPSFNNRGRGMGVSFSYALR
ncbi:MAG TPA: phosphatase PAP2 family protein [Flavipsychrobacter sp.]|nr:phosphatase PAP2 family protein [Flavipsychrobacter sp.]